MYKELVKRNVILIALSLVLFFLLTMFVVSFVNRRNLEAELESLSNVTRRSVYETESMPELSNLVVSYTKDQAWFEIVIANTHGAITLSSNDDALGERPTNRLEQFELDYVADLTQTGAEGDYRIYANGNRLYYICRVTDDIVLRTSVEMAAINNFALLGMFVLLIVLVLVVALSIFFTGKTSSEITAAFDSIAGHLQAAGRGKYEIIDTSHKYEEVERAYTEINGINSSIYRYITGINAERDKLNFIMENIAEGLIIIGMSGNIYAVNNYARRVFGTDFVIGQHYRNFITDEVFREKIEEEMASKSEIRFDYHDEQSDDIYFVSLNSFVHNSEISGEDLISVVLYNVTVLRRDQRTKADFVANASHELKTPITSISGFSELLLSGLVTDPATEKRYVETIHRNAVGMKHTVDDLLYLSKLDYSDKLPHAEEVDVGAVVDTALTAAAQAASGKNVTLVKKGVPSFTIQGDKGLLEHMVGNLVDNAIKYNRNGGTVYVTLEENDGKKLLRVRDTGQGIEPQHLSKLFERFYRIDSSRNRETGGTGLGLTIVHRICALHKAEISVSSTPGVGTEFTVEFAQENQNG